MFAITNTTNTSSDDVIGAVLGLLHHSRLRILLWRTLLCVLIFAPIDKVSGAPIPWKQAAVTYSSKGKPLRQVLKDILASQPFPVVVASDIRGDVHGDFDESVSTIFRSLEAAYDLIWYFDGSVLYISPSSDARAEIVPIAPLRPDQAMQALSRLGLIEARFPIKAASGSMLVSGPSRYVDLVIRALAAEREYAAGAQAGDFSGASKHDSAEKQTADPDQIYVYPLKYAQAQDVSRNIGGVAYTVPGVASILRRLLNGTHSVLAREYVRAHQDTNAVDDIADTRNKIKGVLSERDASTASTPSAINYISEHDGGDARIEADVRTNSVIIYDHPGTRAYYEKAIEQLDRPQRLVQLDIAIIDIAGSAVEDLGVDLSMVGSHVSGGTGGAIGDLGGAYFQGIVGGAATQLTARLAALERQGLAKVLSRPKVLTLDNIEALIGNQNIAYVRVAGAYSTDLYPISVGLQVKVTPQVIVDKGAPGQIRLLLDIVDGHLDEEAKVDSIPISSQNYIATQALVGNGQTLLVGGYQLDNESRVLSGVPVLSHLPMVGGLFRRTTNRRQRTERLFLITPRIVDDALQVAYGSEPQNHLSDLAPDMATKAEVVVSHKSTRVSSLASPVAIHSKDAAKSLHDEFINVWK